MGIESTVLTERDQYGHLNSIAFPNVNIVPLPIIEERTGLVNSASSNDTSSPKFYWFVHEGHFVFVLSQYIKESETNNPRSLTGICASVVTTDFCLTTYYKYLGLCISQYFTNPTTGYSSIVPMAIGASISNKFSLNGLKWNGNDIDPRVDKISRIASLISKLGIESVLLYVAMITKQRVWVHSADPSEVCLATQAILALGAWHREPWMNVRPFVGSSDIYPVSASRVTMDIKDATSPSVYVVGVIDPNYRSRQELWDIFVDLTSNSVTIADHAKSKFTLGKFHKTIAEGLLQLASTEEESNEEDGTASSEQHNKNVTNDEQFAPNEDILAVDMRIVKFCANKTKELINQVKIAGVKEGDEENEFPVTIETIKQHNFPPAMENFLILVAKAEGLMA